MTGRCDLKRGLAGECGCATVVALTVNVVAVHVLTDSAARRWRCWSLLAD